MVTRARPIRLLMAGFCALAAGGALAACGSSSSGSDAAFFNPQTVLERAFSSRNAVKSGVLSLSLSATLTGSADVTSPVSVTFAGPFADQGGKPESAFTVTAKLLGRTGTFGLTTTRSGDYLSLQGAAYTVPATAVGSLGAGSSSSGTLPGLSSLGIDPEHWLTHPRIVSTPTVGGVVVDRITAGVDVAGFLADLNTLLGKEVRSSSAAQSAGVPSSISPATMKKIEAAVTDPTVTVDVGRSDNIVRSLDLQLKIPVTGTRSTELGGATSARIALTTSYSDVNQPQTVTAPANPRSYAQLKTRLNGLFAQLDGAVTGAESGTAGTSGSSTTSAGGSSTTAGSTTAGSTTAGAATGGTTAKYAKCINGSGGDVAKMQKCASLLDTAGG